MTFPRFSHSRTQSSEKIFRLFFWSLLFLAATTCCIFPILSKVVFMRHQLDMNGYVKISSLVPNDKSLLTVDDEVLPVHHNRNRWTSSILEPIIAITCYCTSSILMTLFNKVILIHDQFHLVFSLLTVQSIVCLLLLLLFSSLGLVTHSPFELAKARAWFIVSLCLVLMIYTGSQALKHLSIPVFTIFKNMTIPVVAYSEWWVFKRSSVSNGMAIAFLLMMVSSILAAHSEIGLGSVNSPEEPDIPIILSHDDTSNEDLFGRRFQPPVNTSSFIPIPSKYLGLFWMVANCLSTAGYTLFMKSQIHSIGFKDFDTVFYNNLLCIPILLGFALVFEQNDMSRFGQILFDWYSGADISNQSYASLLWAVFFSCVFTFLISYSTSWCVRVTSSTTYSMVGALNKLPIAIAGMILFATPVTGWNVSAILIAFLGGVLYATAKSTMKKVEYTPVQNLNADAPSAVQVNTSLHNHKD